MQSNKPAKLFERGVTLLEMLISIAVFMFVALAVYQLFDEGQWLYLHSERRSSIQDNARVAMEQLERDLRMVGAGVPIQTQEGSSTLLTPFVFQAEVAHIAFRGDVDNRNTRLLADATGSPLSVEDANAICDASATPIILAKSMKKWAPLSCTFASATTATITSGTIPSYTAEEGLIVSPEHVFYRLVRSDTLIDGDANDDGVCDYTSVPYCILQRAEIPGNAPINSAADSEFETVATNIQSLRFQYFTLNDLDLGYPVSGGNLYAIQRIFVNTTFRDRGAWDNRPGQLQTRAGATQDINLTADILTRVARY